MKNLSGEHNRVALINEVKCKDNEYFIVCLDIISFRTINDMYGFMQGDLILKELINCIDNLNINIEIKSFIYEKDIMNLVVDSTDENEIKQIVKQIVSNIFSYNIKFRCAYRKISDSSRAIEFVENINKVIRKCKYVVNNDKEFDFDSSYDLDEYTAIKQDLIGNDESFFYLVYQPKVEIKTGEIYSCEVLCRWNHPKLGLVKPNKFLPIIRNLNKDCRFDLNIFEMACKEIKSMSKYLKKFSVNMSINTIKEENIYEKIHSITEENNIKPVDVTLEVLEDIPTCDYNSVNKNIDELNRLGFIISIDDFGTGYSSYYRLSTLSFSEVKIPREFLMLNSNDKHENILKAIIGIGKVLGCKIVIEGIETEDHKNKIMNSGADYIQGYYYSKPLKKYDFIKFLEEYNYKM